MMVSQVVPALTSESLDSGGSPAMAAVSFAQRLAGVRARIAAAARRAGHDPGEVLLVAVSKQVEPAHVAEALRAGQTDFGENRAQELGRKVDALGETGVRWHFIGRLQRNKVREVVGVAGLIHSVDRIELAEAIAARAHERGLVQPVLVQVNTGADPEKAGCTVAEAPDLVARVRALASVSCEGLMTIPPLRADPRTCFALLAALRARMPGLRHLSMGMSNDFEAAVEEGATIVRVGEALFGARPTPPARAR